MYERKARRNLSDMQDAGAKNGILPSKCVNIYKLSTQNSVKVPVFKYKLLYLHRKSMKRTIIND